MMAASSESLPTTTMLYSKEPFCNQILPGLPDVPRSDNQLFYLLNYLFNEFSKQLQTTQKWYFGLTESALVYLARSSHCQITSERTMIYDTYFDTPDFVLAHNNLWLKCRTTGEETSTSENECADDDSAMGSWNLVEVVQCGAGYLRYKEKTNPDQILAELSKLLRTKADSFLDITRPYALLNTSRTTYSNSTGDFSFYVESTCLGIGKDAKYHLSGTLAIKHPTLEALQFLINLFMEPDLFIEAVPTKLVAFLHQRNQSLFEALCKEGKFSPTLRYGVSLFNEDPLSGVVENEEAKMENSLARSFPRQKFFAYKVDPLP